MTGAVRPVVETRYGKVRGRRTGGVSAFLGIPYARPPVGPQRFEAPRPPEAWAGVREATVPGPSAPQPRRGSPITLFTRFLQKETSEDCLYLNVWAPDGERLADRRLPVMVWLHGGAFLLGSGSSFLYRGHRLARRGEVVVVTLNYRLGALGFLDLTSRASGDGDGAPANLGLRDQIAALEWVRENAEAFGGDPGNVTVFGESAGAMSAGALLGIPRARGLFRRAILQSGAARNISTPEQAAYRSERFLAAAGIGRKSGGRALVEVLRDLPVEDLVELQNRAMGGAPPRAGRLSWQPTVDGDLIPGQPLEAIRDGAARDVEVTIGTTVEEWKLFTAWTPRLRRMTPAGLERRTADLMVYDELDPGLARDAVATYREGDGRTPYETWIALRSDEYFRMPAIELAEAQARHQPRTFAYLFDFRTPALPRILGSCHALDLPLVFGTQRHPALLPLFLGSRGADRLARRMQDAWIAFARSGSPAGGGLPSWPAYDLEGRATMRLGRECEIEASPLDAERRFWEGAARGARQSASLS